LSTEGAKQKTARYAGGEGKAYSEKEDTPSKMAGVQAATRQGV